MKSERFCVSTCTNTIAISKLFCVHVCRTYVKSNGCVDYMRPTACPSDYPSDHLSDCRFVHLPVYITYICKKMAMHFAHTHTCIGAITFIAYIGAGIQSGMLGIY